MKPVAQTLRRTNQSLCRSSLLFRRSSSFFQERPTRTFVSPRTFSSSKNSCKSRRGALSPNQHRWTAPNGGCSVAGSRKRSLPAGADMDSRFTARAATRDIVIFGAHFFPPYEKKNGGYTVEGLTPGYTDFSAQNIIGPGKFFDQHRKIFNLKDPDHEHQTAVLWIRNLFGWCRLQNKLSGSRSSQGSNLLI
jgi:hypothetical protein